MGYTKGELVQSALNEIGIADYDFDVGAEQVESAMRRLDSMIAMWDNKGIKLGYPVSTQANDSSVRQDSNIPDNAVEAVITNLAVRIAPSYGKIVFPDTKMVAKESLDVLYKQFAMADEMQLGSMPIGAGYKNTDYPFSRAAKDTLKDGQSATLDLEGVFDAEYYK